ncbi:hypothetical protein KC871_03835 [Candidatus Saccharibacteria bacterium]|nr:hypothetical protein [Candidatus Saccharibacteria bacterium]
MYRFKNNYKNYLRYNKHKRACALCAPEDFTIIEQTEYAVVVVNNYPYDIWEQSVVLEHLMVLPLEHKANLSELSPATQNDIMALLAAYETKGYNIYARSVNNKHRSVAHHQHTHLIKIANDYARASLYIEKPYLLKMFGRHTKSKKTAQN